MSNPLILRYFVALIMLILTSIFSVLVINYDLAYLYDENELMEYVQLGTLMIVGIIFWLQANENKWETVQSFMPALRLLAILGAALFFSFIVREMNVKKTEIDWLVFIVDGQGYKALMLLLWIPLLTKAYRHKDTYIAFIKEGYLSPTSVFLAMAVVFLLGGALFDKEIIVVEYFRFYEEVLEMNGYGFMLLAALSFHRDMLKIASATEK